MCGSEEPREPSSRSEIAKTKGTPKGMSWGCGKMGQSCDELASYVAGNERDARNAGVESTGQDSKGPAAKGGRETRVEVVENWEADCERTGGRRRVKRWGTSEGRVRSGVNAETTTKEVFRARGS